MAQQKNGPVIGLAITMVLAVTFVIFWYLTWSDNQKKAGELAAATTAQSDLQGSVNDLNQQINTLRDLIGRSGMDVGVGETEGTDSINAAVPKNILALVGDSIPLEDAVNRAATDRDTERYAATDRRVQYNQKVQELQDTVASKDVEIQTHKDNYDQAKADLITKEQVHSEELAERESQIDSLRKDLQAEQTRFADYKDYAETTIEDLESEIQDKRRALVAMRTKLYEEEDLSFERPDGLISHVDHGRKLCFINLGSRDELLVGTTFSVYTKSNNGVGRRNTEDIKGKIEIVNILGAHSAEARIVENDLDRPVADNDPIYSPIFASGQKLEIAVAGLIDFDGNPGSDRDEFRRLVSGNGATIAVQVTDNGEFADMSGEIIERREAEDRITERTRFLVIADTGDQSETQDADKQVIYRKIQESTGDLKEKALEKGVYVVSMSSFLEYIGYTRKRLTWKHGQAYPGVLSNGAKSARVNSSFGNRTSGTITSGRYSTNRRPATQSTGQTSKVFE